jgi:N-acetylmuramoyl-L-alanine amidase
LIDNGHGNNTAGKRSPWSANKVAPEIEFYEYKWNREIAKPVVDELCCRGYLAQLLVPEEADVPLSTRVERVNNICKEVGKDNVVLVSVHSDAAGNGSKWMDGKGWSAFTTKGKTKSDTFAEFLYDEAEKNFKGRKIRRDTSDGDRDWEANFTIIYKTLCPAVLTENFFYDNIDDVQYILSSEGRAAVIKTHVDGIINYVNYLEDERHKQGYYQTGRG